LQDETHRTEVGEVGDEVRLRKSARDVQTLNVNSGPTAFPEVSADTVGVRQGELAGRIRAPWRHVWQHWARSALGRGHERIFRSIPPSHEPQCRAAGRGASEIREGLDGIGEEHDAEARYHHVEARG